VKASLSEGTALSGTATTSTGDGMNVMDGAKPFSISKRDVWDAYKRVKANRGAAGVDGQSIAEFEENLSANLYKLWNRMASGSYPAVAFGRRLWECRRDVPAGERPV
jgi:RNA-directed DNA polymerase